jgi:hypothetical protein
MSRWLQRQLLLPALVSYPFLIIAAVRVYSTTIVDGENLAQRDGFIHFVLALFSTGRSLLFIFYRVVATCEGTKDMTHYLPHRREMIRFWCWIDL